jgi:hypothetical protein
MKTTSSVKAWGRGLAAVFIFGVGLSIWYSGKPIKPSFSSESRAQIEVVAKKVCAAAREQVCAVTWGGKNKWFGTLEPSSSGLAKAGVDHVRLVLGPPRWAEVSQPNGVSFSDGKIEVFVSAISGAIAITTIEEDSP